MFCLFVYRVLWIPKALWIVLSQTINILINKILGCPQEFYHRFTYIAPSSGHSLLNLNVPFKVILCFLMSGVRMLHVWQDWRKFIQIHQYNTMALLSGEIMLNSQKVCMYILYQLQSYMSSGNHFHLAHPHELSCQSVEGHHHAIQTCHALEMIPDSTPLMIHA